MIATSAVPTYLLVDGENIDATLGMSVLGRRPEPEERPRWDRVLSFCDTLSDQEAGGEDETPTLCSSSTPPPGTCR